VLNSRVSASYLRSTTIVTRLTEHDDVIKSLFRGVPRLSLALDPHLPEPALSTIVHYIPNNYRLLVSAFADGIDYITNFCSMIEQLHELKIAVVNIEAFRNMMFQ